MIVAMLDVVTNQPAYRRAPINWSAFALARASAARKALKPYYQDGQITLYHGDFRAVLPTLPDNAFASLISDPPYNTTCLDFDKEAVDWPGFWAQAHRLCPATAPIVLFASGQFVPNLLASNRQHFRYELIWSKPMAVGFLDARRRPLRAHEQVLIFARQFKGSTYNPQMMEGKPHTRGNKGRPRAAAHYSTPRRCVGQVKTNLYYPRSVFHFGIDRRPNGKSWHPTAKPLALLESLVKTYSDPNTMILDPFAGSGTTLVAALKTGRRAVGIELNESYCEVAAERLRQTAKETRDGKV
jgi:site-specific DNA-methyltransferase (adenine-specific)